MSQTVFITGASAGLGRASALMFAQKGWRVFATMRNPADGADLKEVEGITVLPLDVTDADQIRTITARVLGEHDVDVVFNNAGYGLSGPLDGLSDAKIRRQIDTNLLGVIRVAQAFIPWFKRRGAGRFVTTTSLAAMVGMPLQSVYNATKWALEGWSEALSYELAPHGITVRTVAPGVIRTDFGTRSLDRVATPGSRLLNRAFVDYIMGNAEATSSPEQIAEVVYLAATDTEDRIRYIAGPDAERLLAEHQREGSEGFRRKLGAILAERGV